MWCPLKYEMFYPLLEFFLDNYFNSVKNIFIYSIDIGISHFQYRV